MSVEKARTKKSSNSVINLISLALPMERSSTEARAVHLTMKLSRVLEQERVSSINEGLRLLGREVGDFTQRSKAN